MKQALVCAKCNTIILKSIGGELKIRSKVIVFKDSGAFAVCKGCDTEIPVPLAIDNNLLKSLSESKRLKLYIEK